MVDYNNDVSIPRHDFLVTDCYRFYFVKNLKKRTPRHEYKNAIIFTIDVEGAKTKLTVMNPGGGPEGGHYLGALKSPRKIYEFKLLYRKK